MIGAAAVGLSAGSLARGRGVGSRAGVAAMATVLAAAPLAGLAGGFLWYAMLRFRAAARVTTRTRRVDEAAVEVAELVALGLAGGLSIAAAHDSAAGHAPKVIRSDVVELVHCMRRLGGAAALGADRGPLRATSVVLSGAMASGAPALPALESHIRTEHHRRHAAAVEAARRLPIRLLVPLTLLVLPGFVLITVGPTIVDSLARLSL